MADAQKVEGLAPLAAKTDRIDAYVLAELARRDLVPAIWLPTPGVRAERERARFRLHLVRHRAALKARIHASLIAHGLSCPVSDLFGLRGRELLDRLNQSGASDRRVRLAKNGPEHLRWALVEAAVHAADHPCYAAHYQQTKKRLGRQRGAKVARVEVARKLSEAIQLLSNRPSSAAC
jgi:transposase